MLYERELVFVPDGAKDGRHRVRSGGSAVALGDDFALDDRGRLAGASEC
jgi:hypothetical protein